MKKIILLLAVLLMTAPAMAAVNITVTDAGDGSGWATIAYAETETDFVRAFALDIDANGANIVEIDSVSADYWVFPGTIDINDAGGVNDVGSPIAPAGSPGALGGLGTNGITIEMGALFEAGVDDPPAAEGVLLRIRIDQTDNVCVVGNSMRGNVVMKNATSIDPTEACAEVVVGGLTCWDITECAGQPSGDSTCDGSINFGDLFALKAAFGSTKAGGPPYNCCADFNQDESINFGDLFILKAGFGGSGYSPATFNQSCP